MDKANYYYNTIYRFSDLNVLETIKNVERSIKYWWVNHPLIPLSKGEGSADAQELGG